jgi:hypothetical protein
MHDQRALTRPLLRPLAALLLAGVASAAAQESPVDAAAPALPRYTIELIVFTYDESAFSGDELFVPEFPYPSTADGAPGEVPVFSDLPDAPAETGGEVPADNEISGFDQDLADIPLRGRIELTRLPPEAYAMDDIYQKLVALDAYHPIMRAAWTQTAPPEQEAPAIRLRALGDPPPGLDGTVTLYQGRFVHLGLDLELDAGAAEGLARGAYDPERAATDRAIAQSAFGDDVPAGSGGVAYGDPLPGEGAPVRYRISEVRIMREGTIRYYDHPRFGVIAKLTRAEEGNAQPATATPTPTR